jgi:hypothetical protein
MFTRKFWKDAAERALKTAGQFGVTAWGVTAFTNVGDVVSTGQATGLAALFGAGLSLLTSIGSAPIGPEDSASVVGD